MAKRIELIFPKKNGNSYFKMNVPEEMKPSGLLETIGAREIEECKNFSSHGEQGELHDHAKYKVITNDFNISLDLIRRYNNRN